MRKKKNKKRNERNIQDLRTVSREIIFKLQKIEIEKGKRQNAYFRKYS